MLPFVVHDIRILRMWLLRHPVFRWHAYSSLICFLLVTDFFMSVLLKLMQILSCGGNYNQHLTLPSPSLILLGIYSDFENFSIFKCFSHWYVFFCTGHELQIECLTFDLLLINKWWPKSLILPQVGCSFLYKLKKKKISILKISPPLSTMILRMYN